MLLASCSSDSGKQATPSSSAATSPLAAGSYNCSFQGDPQSPIDVFELRADGTFTIHTFEKSVDNTQGTWSVTGSSATFKAANWEDDFTVQGGRLVFTKTPPSYWAGRTYDPKGATVTAFTCAMES
jgi:hypothetical protein